MIIGEMQHKLATWAKDDRTRRFDRLLRLIATRDWLAEAARIVLASSGARTPGIDGIDRQSLQQDLDDHLEKLQDDLLQGSYRPKPVKRIYIPKANGKLRPLGIPTLTDRIVQRAMLMVIGVNSLTIPIMPSLVHMPDLKRAGEAAGRSLCPCFP